MKIAIDTNILIRLLTGDDPKQLKLVERLILNEFVQYLSVNLRVKFFGKTLKNMAYLSYRRY